MIRDFSLVVDIYNATYDAFSLDSDIACIPYCTVQEKV